MIRPLSGRLHCGNIKADLEDHGVLVIRPLSGRLHCGDTAWPQHGLGAGSVIRPLSGRLHCGEGTGWAEEDLQA